MPSEFVSKKFSWAAEGRKTQTMALTVAYRPLGSRGAESGLATPDRLGSFNRAAAISVFQRPHSATVAGARSGVSRGSRKCVGKEPCREYCRFYFEQKSQSDS